MQAVPALGFGNLVLVEGEGALAFYLEVLLRAAVAQQGLGVVAFGQCLAQLMEGFVPVVAVFLGAHGGVLITRWRSLCGISSTQSAMRNQGMRLGTHYSIQYEDPKWPNTDT